MTTNRELIEKLCDRPIAFNPAFVPIGGICGALMLSQAIYWSRRTSDPDGWFYKTQKDWRAETGMTRAEQEKARRALKSAGVLEENLSGVPAKLYYRVDFDTLTAAVMAEKEGDQAPPSSLREHDKLDCSKQTSKIAGNEQTITETTTETTTDISVPTGTGAKAPADDLFGGKPEPKSKEGELTHNARARMWRLGVEILTGQGMAESSARAFIGKQAKAGETKLAGLIGEIAVRTPADARSYIIKAMSGRAPISTPDQAKQIAEAEGVPIRRGDTFEKLRDRIYEYRNKGESHDRKQAAGTGGD